MKPLGSIAIELEPSDDDINRIGALLLGSDDYKNELMDLITTSTQGKRLLDRLKINGFRKGSHGFYKKGVTQIFIDLVKGSHDKRCWDAYKLGVGEFIDKNYKSFQNLLRNTKVPDDLPDEEILTQICLNAKYYKVTPERIEWFYNAYFLPRENELEKLLNLCLVGDPELDKEYRAREISEDLATLADRVEKIEAESASKIDASESLVTAQDLDSRIASLRIEESFAELQDSIQVLTDSNRAVSDSLVQIDSNLSRVEEFAKSLDFKTRKLQDSLDSKHVKLRDLEKDRENIESNTRKFLEKEISIVKKDLVALCEELIAAQKVRLESLISTGSALGTPAAQFNTSHSHREIPTSTLKREAEFLEILSAEFARNGLTGKKEVAYAFHRIFISNSVLVLDSTSVFDLWVDCLNWTSNNIDMVASPSWVSEEDWKVGSEYLFRDSERLPNILKIFDFDVGVVEGYLRPTLKLWSLRNGNPKHAKLVLVPESPATFTPSNQLIESAVCVRVAELAQMIDEGLGNTELLNQGSKLLVKSGKKNSVSVGQFLEWNNSSTLSEELCQEEILKIRPLENSLDLTFDSFVLHKYAEMKCGLSSVLDVNLAESIALEFVIRPWLKNSYNEEKYSELCELLSEFSI